MKKSDLKNLVKTVIKEMVGDSSVQAQTQLAQLAKKFEEIDKKARTMNVFSKERVALEDERMKIWWQIRKMLQQKQPAVAEDHSMGYSHNVGMPADTNTMNKSTIDPLKEYKDVDTRIKAVSQDPIRGLKLIYQWVKIGAIDFNEFSQLLRFVK